MELTHTSTLTYVHKYTGAPTVTRTRAQIHPHTHLHCTTQQRYGVGELLEIRRTATSFEIHGHRGLGALAADWPGQAPGRQWGAMVRGPPRTTRGKARGARGAAVFGNVLGNGGSDGDTQSLS